MCGHARIPRAGRARRPTLASGHDQRAATLVLLLAGVVVLCSASFVPAQIPVPMPLRWECGGPFGGTVEGLAPSTDGWTDHVVAATYGGGIFLSEDTGQSWTRADGLTSYYATCLALLPPAFIGEPSRLLAGIESQEDWIPLPERSNLVKSLDGGLSWFESSEGIQNDSNGRSIVLALAYSTTNRDVAYAGCAAFGFPPPPPKVYKSVDGGAAWSGADSGHAGYSYSLSVQPGNGDVVISGSDYGIHRTTDGAASWSYMGLAAGPIQAVMFVPFAPQVALAGSPVGIYRSGDAGENWTLIMTPGAPSGLVTCFAADLVSGALYAGTDREGVFRSDDLGLTWQSVPSGAGPIEMMTELLAAPWAARSSFVAGTRYRGTYTSPDAGTWTWSSEGLTASHSQACEILPAGRILAGVDMFGVATSDDGYSWSYASGVPDDESVLCFCEDPAVSEFIYAGTDSGNVYSSGDLGETWSHEWTFDGPVRALAFDPQVHGRMYAAVWGDSFYVTEDGGATWVGHWFDNGGSQGIGVNPQNGRSVLVATHRIMDPGIYRTLDGGETWAYQAFMYPAHSIAYDPTDTTYAYCGGALDWGIWRSEDGGATWDILPNYPGGAGTSEIAVEPDGGALWATKRSKGVFRSLDRGDSWVDVSGALVNRNFRWIDAEPWVEPERGGIFSLVALGTDGAGVYVNREVPTSVPGPWGDDPDEPVGAGPAGAALRAHPNPTSGPVAFSVPASRGGGVACVRVYDLSGRLVRELVGSGASRVVEWDRRDASGHAVAAGVYVAEAFVADSGVGRTKFVVLR